MSNTVWLMLLLALLGLVFLEAAAIGWILSGAAALRRENEKLRKLSEEKSS